MIPSTFPIDYVIFSSGAGIIHWATGKLIYEQCISAEDTERAANYLYTNENTFLQFIIRFQIITTLTISTIIPRIMISLLVALIIKSLL